MSDFTHARVCIRHGGGSVEIQAPAGEVTWLDLSGLHAPAASGPPRKAGKTRLAVTALASCAAGVAMGLVLARPVASVSSEAFADRFAGPAPAFEFPASPPHRPTPALPANPPPAPVPPAPAGSGAGAGSDPFGLRSR